MDSVWSLVRKVCMEELTLAAGSEGVKEEDENLRQKLFFFFAQSLYELGSRQVSKSSASSKQPECEQCDHTTTDPNGFTQTQKLGRNN